MQEGVNKLAVTHAIQFTIIAFEMLEKKLRIEIPASITSHGVLYRETLEAMLFVKATVFYGHI